MANGLSTQQAKRAASPPQDLIPTEAHPGVRYLWFDYTVPASGGPGIGETIELRVRPARSRIVGGRFTNTAGAASSTVQIGITGTAGKYSAAIAVTAAGTSDAIANTQALNFGEVTTADETVIATVAGAALQAGQVLKGYLAVLMD